MIVRLKIFQQSNDTKILETEINSFLQTLDASPDNQFHSMYVAQSGRLDRNRTVYILWGPK